MRFLRSFGSWLARARERWLDRALLSPARSALAGFVLLASLVAMIAACTRTAGIDFLITVPNSLSSQVMWIEVSVYKDVQCSLAGRVAYGEAPTEGPVKRLIWSPTDGQPAPPELGDLESGYYAFVVQVKNTNCEIIARGCDGLDIGDGGTIRIPTKPDSQNGPGCDSSMTCELGQCIPKRTGQNCSLDVVGSGPLVQGSEGTGLIVAAPAARFVGSDFLVSYGEFSSDVGTTTTLISQLIARNGGLRQFVPTQFARRCSGYPQNDGTGLAWSAEGTGLVGFARNECTNGELQSTAVELMMIDANANFKDERAATLNLSSAELGEIRFGQNHAIASLGGGKWAISPVIAGRAEAVFIEEVNRPGTREEGGGNTFEVSDAEGGAGQVRYQFGLSDARQVSANLEASGTSVVMVAINEYGEEPPPPEEDGGESDAGPDGGDDDAGDASGQAIRQQPDTIGFRKLSVQFLPIDKVGALAPLPTPFAIESRFASVAMIANRALVVGDDNGDLQNPTLFAFDFDPNGNQAVTAEPLRNTILTNGEAQGTEVDYADIAVANDRAFVATAIPGDIILTVFSQASNQPSVLRSLRLSQVRASTVGSIRNGRVTVAANQNRVLVAWTTATELKDNDPIGGYAIFACEP